MAKERYYQDRNALFEKLTGRILDIGCNWIQRAYLWLGLKAFAKLFPETQFAIGDRGARVCRWWWA